VPVEIVEPALVKIVGREVPPGIVQVVDRRPEGLLSRKHARLLRQQPALAEVAGGTGSDNVLPGRLATHVSRNNVIEGQVVLRAAVLALEMVAEKDVETG